jgi:hypothetical protein
MTTKTLQYIVRHSDIGVMLNTYTHLGLEDAADELKRMEDLEQARKELDRSFGKKKDNTEYFQGSMNKMHSGNYGGMLWLSECIFCLCFLKVVHI